jgi:hypothetical protein
MTITPHDVLKQLALAAGYRVHVWDAIENGDAADSYFWKTSSTSAMNAQSQGTFASPELAWLDCCQSTMLLLPILEEIERAGCRVARESGFIAYQWLNAEGEVSAERYASPAEALIACAMTLISLDAQEEQQHLSPR